MWFALNHVKRGKNCFYFERVFSRDANRKSQKLPPPLKQLLGNYSGASLHVNIIYMMRCFLSLETPQQTFVKKGQEK